MAAMWTMWAPPRRPRLPRASGESSAKTWRKHRKMAKMMTNTRKNEENYGKMMIFKAKNRAKVLFWTKKVRVFFKNCERH